EPFAEAEKSHWFTSFCDSGNCFSSVSQSSAMDVQADAEVIVENGTTGIMHCSFNSNQVVSSFTQVIWTFSRGATPSILVFKNGKSLPAVGEFKERLHFIGDFNYRDVSIQLSPVKFSDSGNYLCRVYNLHDQLVKRVQTELRVVLRDELSTNPPPTGEFPTTLVLISVCVFVTISATVLTIYCKRRSR
uniref:Ig-like domain-containing protein n=1 Tax=Neogobius melanostomus TaxID=47308 RepID=A0A8C6S952_9GOBI